MDFEEFTVEHAISMKSWGDHKDPLFYDYNFRLRNDLEVREFMNQKAYNPFCLYYAIINEGEMIGFIGLKRINAFTKNSTLGLVLNPDEVDKGYGSTALYEFLKIYFHELGFNKMVLDVASYNKRALRLYEKMGFKITKKSKMRYENPYNTTSDEEFLRFPDCFIFKNGKVLNYFYKMRLTKSEFLRKEEEFEV